MALPVLLVPLDGTLHTLVALPVARALARVSHATVVTVHVSEDRVPPPDLARRLGLEREDLRGTVVDLRSGDPADVILRVSRERSVAMVIMCAHTAVLEPVGILGPTAARVLREAPCPVIVVRPQLDVSKWSLKRVLLPHDGTPTTTAALGPALALAQKAGARLHVLHVADPDARPDLETGTLTAPRYVDQRQHEWPSWASEFLERLACSAPLDISELRLSLARGDPSSEIVRFATEKSVDLIVLAWRGAVEPDRAQAVRGVLREAPCPVMVLHPEIGEDG